MNVSLLHFFRSATPPRIAACLAARFRDGCTGTRGARLSFALVGLLLSSGCSVLPQATDDPTRYYVLSAQPAANDTGEAAGRFTVRLQSIELPAYLRHTKSMVVRRGVNELHYEDFARWAEPLDLGLHRVLKERLIEGPAIRAVESPPFLAKEPRDFDLRVRVLRCEGGVSRGGQATVLFSAVYEITRTTGKMETVMRRTFNASGLEWDGHDYADLASKISGGAGELAAAMLADLPAQ